MRLRAGLGLEWQLRPALAAQTRGEEWPMERHRDRPRRPSLLEKDIRCAAPPQSVPVRSGMRRGGNDKYIH